MFIDTNWRQSNNKALDSGLALYHGAHRSTTTQIALRFGPIDFSFIHENGRILVAEQENGAWEGAGQGIVKFYGNGRRKIVGDQLHTGGVRRCSGPARLHQFMSRGHA